MKLLYISICAIAIGMFASCTPDPKEVCKQYQIENDSLKKSILSQEAQLNEISSTMDEVESNLASVQQSETAIEKLKAGKGNAANNERINVYIEQIRSTISDNSAKVAELERKYRGSQANSAGMKKLISRLKEIIRLKEIEIDSLSNANQNLAAKIGDLNATLNKKDAELASKSTEIDKKKKEVETMDNERNTAYVLIGTDKELVANGIVEKKGGVLGMGKTKRLVSNLDKSKFKTVNIRGLADIDLGVIEKSMLLSNHPTDSYTIVSSNQRATLKIVDAARFWSITKYLVVEVK